MYWDHLEALKCSSEDFIQLYLVETVETVSGETVLWGDYD